jgi:hypothetical protein
MVLNNYASVLRELDHLPRTADYAGEGERLRKWFFRYAPEPLLPRKTCFIVLTGFR